MSRSVAVILGLFLFLSGSIYAQGTVVETSFYSAALGYDRFVQIYLPDGYDPVGDIDYPVVYFLHGVADDHTGYPFIIGILDSLIENQIIEPVIVVKPDGRSVPYIVSWYTNSILNGAFEDYIVSDLVNFVETNYRALPIREKRYLMGHSAGGYGSMSLGLKHPDIYSRLAAHSGVLELNVLLVAALPYLLAEYPGGPPYNWNPAAGFFSGVFFSLGAAFSPNFANPPYYVDLPLDSLGNLIGPVWDLWLQHNPPTFAAMLPPNSDLAIYFDCGTMDEMGCYPQNTVFASILDQLGLDYEFQSYVGDHSNRLPERFPIGLAFLVGIEATADYGPDVLNLKSHGRWITCYIELPEGYSAEDIDINTVALTAIDGESIDPPLYREGPTDIGDYDEDGIADLMVKFKRADVIEILVETVEPPADVELTVSGELTSDIPFEGSDMIHIIDPFSPQAAEDKPCSFVLHESQPNPFSSNTDIRYTLLGDAHVRLEIYDVSGRAVKTLINGIIQAGYHNTIWDGRDNSNRQVASGIYFIKLVAGDHSATERVLLVK